GRRATDRCRRTTSRCRGIRSASVITCAAAAWRGCACSTSKSLKWSPQSSGVSPPSRAVFETLVAALARLRVALGWVFGLLVIVLAQPTLRTITIGMSIAVVGEAIRIWAAGHLNKSREVTSSGPYRFVGHPLYLGSCVMGLGLAVACNSVLVAALIAFYLATTITAAIKSEEAFLRRHFGEQYDLYRCGVAERRRSPGARQRRFSLRQAIRNREHRAVLGLAIAILLLALKATYNGSFWRAAVVRPGG